MRGGIDAVRSAGHDRQAGLRQLPAEHPRDMRTVASAGTRADQGY